MFMVPIEIEIDNSMSVYSESRDSKEFTNGLCLLSSLIKIAQTLRLLKVYE